MVNPIPLRDALMDLSVIKELQERSKKAAVKAASETNNRQPDPDGSPICASCRRTAGEIPSYIDQANYEEIPADEYAEEDGTYRAEKNMFLCDECYIAHGMPVGDKVDEVMEACLANTV